MSEGLFKDFDDLLQEARAALKAAEKLADDLSERDGNPWAVTALRLLIARQDIGDWLLLNYEQRDAIIADRRRYDEENARANLD